MSELNSTIDFLESAAEIETPPTDNLELVSEEKKDSEFNFFNIQQFGQELYNKSETRNRERAMRLTQNITGYDIAHNCLQQVLFKLRNTPLKNYADSWLPIFMRTEVGSAVHNFIQNNTSQFTETELNLKVPSIGFYGKIDYMIGDNVLGEIKTCTYSDYKWIIRHQKPREKDFLQAFTYHYVISNYIDEILDPSITIRSYMGLKPKLPKYNITKLQFLYIAHDIISSHAETYTEMMEIIQTVKKNLNSKNNPFFFMTSVVVDLDEDLINKTYEYIRGKFDDIHHYMQTRTNPTEENQYIKNDCFFCPYRQVCHLKPKKQIAPETPEQG